MNPFFDFVVAIVALSFVYKLIDSWLRNKQARRPADDAVAQDLMRRLAEVEERVRVLERIVTDDRYDLKQQFKDLGT
jgi:glycyl-tRNA synthetase beta subunit